MSKIISTQEYARLRQVSPVAVTRAMKKGQQLIGVSSYRKIGRDWFLTVRNDVAKINKGRCVVIQE